MGRDAGIEGRTKGRLVLRADVASFPLADALGALHGAQLTGRLDFSYEGHRKAFWLQRGEVVFATSNQKADRLGECLVRAGGLRLSQLREAEICYRPPGRFGKVLVERGFLTPRELWNAVRHQVEEIVRSLFAYPGGDVRFSVEAGEPENVVRLALETRRLVAEGLQRRGELHRFLEVLDDPRVQLARGECFRGDLAGTEQALAESLGNGASFGEVCQRLDLSRESAARSVQLLRLVGAVKLRRGVCSASTPDADADTGLLELARRGVRRVRVLLDALTVADGEGARGGVEERLDHVLDDLTARFPALLTGFRLHGRGDLDPIRLADRARQVPGDSLATLDEALTELLAYLEFEVKNHPGIGDPDRVLAPEPRPSPHAPDTSGRES